MKGCSKKRAPTTPASKPAWIVSNIVLFRFRRKSVTIATALWLIKWTPPKRPTLTSAHPLAFLRFCSGFFNIISAKILTLFYCYMLTIHIIYRMLFFYLCTPTKNRKYQYRNSILPLSKPPLPSSPSWKLS